MLSPAGLTLPDHLLEVAAESEQNSHLGTATVKREDAAPSVGQQTLFGDGGGGVASGSRGRLMLFPRGDRPPKLTFTLVSEPGKGHRIYRPDAWPPYANPSRLPRFLGCTCGLVMSSLTDHP